MSTPTDNFPAETAATSRMRALARLSEAKIDIDRMRDNLNSLIEIVGLAADDIDGIHVHFIDDLSNLDFVVAGLRATRWNVDLLLRTAIERGQL